MNETRFRSVLLELIDENPFAIRAVLRILAVEFTKAVPTLAVTCEERPRLLVNLDFVQQHCRTDAEVKALLCHEFLHVLLRHTEQRRCFTRARHLALDAVINAIIHRQHGAGYSGMMSRYYAKARGLAKLLRPMNADEIGHYNAMWKHRVSLPAWVNAWAALYEGTLLADDIEAVAIQMARGCDPDQTIGSTEDLGPFTLQPGDDDFNWMLGNHVDVSVRISEALKDALDRAMKEMNGSGIWRAPGTRGVASNPYEAIVTARNDGLEGWQRSTLALLREHLLPDPRSRALRDTSKPYCIPVLSPGDRRAFLRAQWSPFLPDAQWHGATSVHEGSAFVYLDVSGSMNAEMPLVIALLARLAPWIRRPLWSFSDIVAPAIIERGQLRTTTTGGTSLKCVMDHVARTRPAAAIVVTDGYVEQLDRERVRQALAATRLTALVTRDGNPAALKRAGIPYRQLEKVPA